MSLDVATQWCGQYGAVVLNPMDDEPTFHAGGADSPDLAVRFLTLCGRRAMTGDLYLRVDHASRFARPCQSCIRVHRARWGDSGLVDEMAHWDRRRTLVVIDGPLADELRRGALYPPPGYSAGVTV